MIKEKNSDGVSSGIVIRVRRTRRPAPSTTAASYSSDGMPCKPAKKIKVKKPTCFQTSIKTMERKAQVDELNQGTRSDAQTRQVVIDDAGALLQQKPK